VLPAIAFLILSKLGAVPRLPRVVRLFFRWFGWVGNVTLAVYCVAVATWAVSGFRQPDLQLAEAALLALVAATMLILALSFWRTAQRLSR
jgi:hypothetical protein